MINLTGESQPEKHIMLITIILFMKITLETSFYSFATKVLLLHYNDVIMSAMAPQNIQGADHRKYQSSASLAFVRGIRR